jgi:hypothetical protein
MLLQDSMQNLLKDWLNWSASHQRQHRSQTLAPERTPNLAERRSTFIPVHVSDLPQGNQHAHPLRCPGICCGSRGSWALLPPPRNGFESWERAFRED